ncbi:MAG: hypothetical protein NC453_12615, partial [Muribaculum sp.]|nr:hypothetical protein [Muribaculum sp.]
VLPDNTLVPSMTAMLLESFIQRLGSRCSLPQRYGTAASEPLQEASESKQNVSYLGKKKRALDAPGEEGPKALDVSWGLKGLAPMQGWSIGIRMLWYGDHVVRAVCKGRYSGASRFGLAPSHDNKWLTMGGDVA